MICAKEIKTFLGRNIINKVKYFISFIYFFKFIKYKKRKKIFHMSIPVHGNMGDQAIVFATNRYLKEKFREYEIIEVYRKEIYKYAKAIKAVLNQDDLIVLIGGGNMGNLWIDEEEDRRFIINKFFNNKIISMPQTISFTNDENGKKELNKTKDIYNKHNNLTIIAREEKSFEIMKREFYNAKVILNPDIVLYLDNLYEFYNNNRNRIMTCLRSDKEGVLGNKKVELIKNLNDKYNEVFNYDTVIDKIITKETRERELKTMFNEFLKSNVVITDRLHGMLFCVITKTPCIVTRSLDHKVTGTYEWIKELSYVKLVDDLNCEKVEKLITELMEVKKNRIDFKKIYFNGLRKKVFN